MECLGQLTSAAVPGEENITSENVTYKNYINTTWVAREIPNFVVPTDQEIFGKVMNDKKLFDGLF